MLQTKHNFFKQLIKNTIKTTLIALLCFCVFLSNPIFSKPLLKPLKRPYVITINYQEHFLSAEVVSAPKERAKGLMYREFLPTKNGMLFIFGKERVAPFWMKNTYIPLDIIWLNKQKQVVFIKRNAKPLDETPIVPNKKATYVLELNADQAQKLHIKKGCFLKFNLN